MNACPWQLFSMQYAKPVCFQESCESVPCHLTCKEHTSFQKCNIGAEGQERRICSPDIPPINHMDIRNTRPQSDTKGQSCETLQVETKLQPPRTQRRGVDKGNTAPLSAAGWLVHFAPLLLFKQLRPQKSYRLLQSWKAPSHRVAADGNPGEKSKHRFTLIWWLTDITVSHQRYRSTRYSPVRSLTKAGLKAASLVRQHKQDDEQS